MDGIVTVDDVFNAMDDSITAINGYIESGKKDCVTYEALIANIRALEVALDKDYVKNAGRDLAKYSDACKAAHTFMGM